MKWVEIARVLKEREAYVSERQDRKVERKAWQTLQHKSSTIQSMDSQADQFRHTSLLSSAFTTLRTQARLAPLFAQFKHNSGSRVLKSALQKTHSEAQEEIKRQADVYTRQHKEQQEVISKLQVCRLF